MRSVRTILLFASIGAALALIPAFLQRTEGGYESLDAQRHSTLESADSALVSPAVASTWVSRAAPAEHPPREELTAVYRLAPTYGGLPTGTGRTLEEVLAEDLGANHTGKALMAIQSAFGELVEEMTRTLQLDQVESFGPEGAAHLADAGYLMVPVGEGKPQTYIQCPSEYAGRVAELGQAALQLATRPSYEGVMVTQLEKDLSATTSLEALITKRCAGGSRLEFLDGTGAVVASIAHNIPGIPCR